MAGNFFPITGDQAINAKKRIQYVSATQILYGYAAPGTSEDAAGWLIFRETLDSSGRTTHIDFANSTLDASNIWSSRSTYTYG